MQDILQRLEDKSDDHLDKIKFQKMRDKGIGSGRTGNRGHATQPRGPYQQKTPAPNPDCRVCKQMEKHGVTPSNLNRNHLGQYTHKCPQFVAMTQVDRFRVCSKAKICLCCINSKEEERCTEWDQ